MENKLENITIGSYPILSKLHLENKSLLITFDSYPREGKSNDEILGKEIFLFSEEGNVIWQIQPERGGWSRELQKLDPDKIDRAGFIYVRPPNANPNYRQGPDEYIAMKFYGDTFTIDLATGHAKWKGWEKN